MSGGLLYSSRAAGGGGVRELRHGGGRALGRDLFQRLAQLLEALAAEALGPAPARSRRFGWFREGDIKREEVVEGASLEPEPEPEPARA